LVSITSLLSPQQAQSKEFGDMIREVESLAAATVALPAFPTSPEAIESEINRLTWSVLDGSASPADRGRLAELVRTQHALRPRAIA
jgi:hypothetical protein